MPQSRGHAPLTVLLLAPPDGGDETIAESLRRALTAADVHWCAFVPDTIAPAHNHVLVLSGGMGVRGFLDVDAVAPGTLRADVVEAIRSAHRAGVWIGAPCVALAVVLKALEDEVARGAANRRLVAEGVAVFPDLRVVSTSRPLLGRACAELEPLIERFTATLLGESARRVPAVASLTDEHA